MARKMPFRIGADASCRDGACGHVSRLIVDPVAREITHLVVDPKHRPAAARLVPVDLADTATDQLRLRCSLAEFQALEPAQQIVAVPDLDPTGHAHAPRRARYLGSGPGIQRGAEREPQAPQEVTVDSVPADEVDIRRELSVWATDGEIGQVRGLIAEPRDHRVTHVLLQRGHLLGRQDVAIPISAVTKFGTMIIHLSITRRQVKNLPRVDTDHPTG